MRTDQFDFNLPQERIAQKPAYPRDSSRLLEISSDKLGDHGVLDLPNLLKPDDLLVLNDTRVIPTRLHGRRGNARIEVTLHKPGEKSDTWYAFARPGRRLRTGDEINFADGFSAQLIKKLTGGEVLLQLTDTTGSVIDAIHSNGAMPLPPYIQRAGQNDPNDAANYQTIYARQTGAVAAPTAGLHFTERLFQRLDERGVHKTFVTLHVGAGTFLPIKGDTVEEHRMHAEYGVLSTGTVDAIERTRDKGGKVVAVGSTALRLIETATAEDSSVRPFEGDTDLFITPGYRFKAVDLFLTNFHLPRSTLFVLVSAFAGIQRMKDAYTHAITAGYRFYSYGDCCLIHRADPT